MLGVANLGRVKDFYEALGGRRHPRGVCSRVFIEPDGHPWEVAHNPGWVMHDDGTVSLSER